MPRCSKCSAEVPAASRFCGNCGSVQDDATLTAGEVTISDPISHSSVAEGRFAAGTVLDGRYRIIGMLGKGGMGEVYRADDLKLGQTVALKFLPASMERDRSRLALLLNEVRLARQVSHPNVCRVYDLGELDGSHFMAMEYVDGEDLSSLLRRIGRLPHEKALEISRQICAGLYAAHEQGILHRDLKPGNVMLDGNGRVKLTDFGLAGLASQMEGSQGRVGTPAYMAPEQHAGGEASLRSDIYSLGLLLYEIFTGQRPFSGKTAGEIARHQAESSPTTPSSVVADVDHIVEQVILRCLEKEPNSRPPSALSVAAALPGGDPLAAALAAGETPSVEMVADAGASGGLRPLVGVAALLAIVLAVGLFISSSQNNDLYAQLPLEQSAEDLSARAVLTLERMGIQEIGRIRRAGFDAYTDYLEWVEESSDSPARWDSLATGRPPGAYFWFRYSDTELLPDNLHTFFVSESDPTQRSPGEGNLRLDLQGKLLGYEIQPARLIPESHGEGDWYLPFALAGLDSARFTPVEPVRSPGTPCDELRAWRGPVFGDLEGVVQVGQMAGKPSYFEILGPWNLEELESSNGPAGGMIFGLIIFAVLSSAIVLARRNLKARRGDVRGTFKVMLFFVLVIFGAWFLPEVRLRTLSVGSLFEDMVFGRLLGHGLVHAVLAGVLYLALEPYVRRLWPETLVSWNRLLMGRIRDPLVGRDLLLGMAIIGSLTAVLSWLAGIVLESSGIAPPLARSFMGFDFNGLRYVMARVLIEAESALSVSMMLLIVLLLLRLVLRRSSLAVAAVLIIVFAGAFAGDASSGAPTWMKLLSAFSFAGIVAVSILCMLRFGLLSVVGGVFFNSLIGGAALTWDFTEWYAGAGLAAIVVLFALAGWAFYTSLAGRQLFKDSILE